MYKSSKFLKRLEYIVMEEDGLYEKFEEYKGS